MRIQGFTAGSLLHWLIKEAMFSAEFTKTVRRIDVFKRCRAPKEALTVSLSGVLESWFWELERPLIASHAAWFEDRWSQGTDSHQQGGIRLGLVSLFALLSLWSCFRAWHLSCFEYYC